MSLILDALRGARARPTPQPSSNAAQTDAVLQTLGYGRFSGTSRFSRIKRLAGYLVAGIICAGAIWVSVFWLTKLYLTHYGATDTSGADGLATPAPRQPPRSPV